jgi:hypothetical protein
MRLNPQTMLNHNRLRRCSRIGEVIQFVMPLVVVDDDVRHAFLLLQSFDNFCYNYTKLITARSFSDFERSELGQILQLHRKTVRSETLSSL